MASYTLTSHVLGSGFDTGHVPLMFELCEQPSCSLEHFDLLGRVFVN